GERELILFDLSTLQETRRISCGAAFGGSECRIDPTGRWLALASGKSPASPRAPLTLLRLSDGNETLSFGTDSILRVSFGPDGGRLAALHRAAPDEWAITIWDTATGQVVRTIPLPDTRPDADGFHGHERMALAFTADGSAIGVLYPTKE